LFEVLLSDGHELWPEWLRRIDTLFEIETVIEAVAEGLRGRTKLVFSGLILTSENGSSRTRRQPAESFQRSVRLPADLSETRETAHMVQRFFPAFTIAAAVTAAACSSQPLAPTDIVGTTWQLNTIHQNGSDLISVVEPARYTLQLQEDGRVAVKSDCNSCGGSYTLSGSSLTLSQVACTKVFCGDRSFDQSYSRALEGAITVSVNGSEMTTNGNGVTLVFTRAEAK
jgi:heat shock protein HslJ